MSKLKNKDFEPILERIVKGDMLLDIAKDFSVRVSTLHQYLNKSERYLKTSEALRLSAASYANKAEDILRAAEGKSSTEVQRAQHLAGHFRWMASKRAPRSFGDKIDITTDGEKIIPPPDLDLSKLSDDDLKAFHDLASKASDRS